MLRPSQLAVNLASSRSVSRSISKHALGSDLLDLMEQSEEVSDIDCGQCASSGQKDWQSLETAVVGLFSDNLPLLQPNQLVILHEQVKKVLDSKAGPFFVEYFKTKMLPRGMAQLLENLIISTTVGSDGKKGTKGNDLLFVQEVAKCWELFFSNILPTLDAILFRVKCKGNLSIRQTSLVLFRDDFLLRSDFEECMERLLLQKEQVPFQIKRMTLILQAVIDCFPPNKSKLRLERIAASLVTPYLGYMGLYTDFECKEPKLPSTEPQLHATRKLSSDVGARRLSRPFSMQPKQVETLNELFRRGARKS